MPFTTNVYEFNFRPWDKVYQWPLAFLHIPHITASKTKNWMSWNNRNSIDSGNKLTRTEPKFKNVFVKNWMTQYIIFLGICLTMFVPLELVTYLSVSVVEFCLIYDRGNIFGTLLTVQYMLVFHFILNSVFSECL